MAQIKSSSARQHYDYAAQWRKPLSFTFHSVLVSVYFFAICWHKLSTSSAELYIRSDPGMRVYGKWRFLTFNCLIMQFLAYLLCLMTHFIPSLRKIKDFWFTTLAFPIGMLVVVSFWLIWFIAGREYIFPVNAEEFYPPWLNHVTHTIILPVNFLEIILVQHKYSKSIKSSIISLVGFMATYTTFVLYIRYQTGRFVYPFLNKMDPIAIGMFMIAMAIYTIIMYQFGKFLNNLIHISKKEKFVR